MKGRGIEFKPDMGDPKRVRMEDGLPEGVSRAEITFRVSGGLPGTRVVRRSVAEFARLDATVVNPQGGWSIPSTRLTVAEADQYIEQVRRRLDERDDGIRRRREAVDLRCPWCGQERNYIGVLGFITGSTKWRSDEPTEGGQQVVQQHAYRCESCGSMAYFADGYLPHPLPGGHRS